MNRFMIMLFGKMGCGKSVFARQLSEYIPSKIVNVSSILSNQFDILTKMSLRSTAIGDDFEDLLFAWGLVSRTNIPLYIREYIKNKENNKRVASLYKRAALQKYGTEIAILVDKPRIFVHQMALDIVNNPEMDKYSIFINDGCRFPFEIDTVERFGFIPIPIILHPEDDKQLLDTYYERYDSGYDYQFGFLEPMFHYSEFGFTTIQNDVELVFKSRMRDDSPQLKLSIGKIINTIENLERSRK